MLDARVGGVDECEVLILGMGQERETTHHTCFDASKVPARYHFEGKQQSCISRVYLAVKVSEN